MSMPDHGEYEVTPTAIPERDLIDMGKTFLQFYVESGEQRDFDAALTMFGKAYRRTFQPKPAPGLKEMIEKAAEPPKATEPHFSDKAEPGPVVPITLVTPLFKPPVDPPNQIEEPE